ncbi:DUF6090 family protein [Geojedonia litorea]|uniref:DUF6090 family protein n=1 Tax=Geojedonia litorea TaxID=1268269 RepID=A0ABV9N0A9_9FLAO
MGKGKTTRYFKYAVGEIILVVIGILIALGINNLNENRKENIQEQYLLKQIKKDILVDSSLIYRYASLTYGKTIQAKHLKKAVLAKRYDISIDTLALNSFFIGKLVLFDAYTPTFDELVSSGNLGVIKSENLKSAFKRYKNTNEGIKSFLYDESQKRKEAYNTHLHKYFEPQITTFLWESLDRGKINKDSLLNYKMDIKGFMDDPKTLDHINTMIGIDRELNWNYSQRRIKTIQQIIEIVSDEIQK